MSVAARLRQAMSRADLSVRALSRQLQKRDVTGASRGSIAAYLSEDPDTQEPSLEFLRAAAEVLAVPAAWLMAVEEPQGDVLASVVERHEIVRGMDLGHRQLFMDLLFSLHAQCSDRTAASPETSEASLQEMLRLSDYLVLVMTVPLGLWGVRGPASGPPPFEYLHGILGALMSVVRRGNDGDRLAELDRGFEDRLGSVLAEERERLRKLREDRPAGRAPSSAPPPPPVMDGGTDG